MKEPTSELGRPIAVFSHGGDVVVVVVVVVIMRSHSVVQWAWKRMSITLKNWTGFRSKNSSAHEPYYKFLIEILGSMSTFSSVDFPDPYNSHTNIIIWIIRIRNDSDTHQELVAGKQGLVMAAPHDSFKHSPKIKYCRKNKSHSYSSSWFVIIMSPLASLCFNRYCPPRHQKSHHLLETSDMDAATLVGLAGPQDLSNFDPSLTMEPSRATFNWKVDQRRWKKSHHRIQCMCCKWEWYVYLR